MSGTGQALAGVRVLDLSDAVAGPTAARLLAAYGADVVKLETADGDVTRTWGPFPRDEPHPEKSGYFLSLNTGKRGVRVDASSAEGRDVIGRLAAAADVVIESFGPGGLDAVGLSWQALHDRSPKTVLLSISPYGHDGPRANAPASALTSFASGGQMWLTGDPEDQPRKSHGHQAAYQAGFHAFAAALALTVGARRHGRGDHVRISMQEVQASTLEMYGPNAWNHGVESYRMGNTVRATWAIYPCADGWVGAHGLPRNVPSMMRAIGEDELAEKYATNPAALLEDNDLIEALMFGWCIERTKDEIFRIATEKRAPFAYIPNVAELLAWPGLTEKGFFVELEHPEAGTLPYAGPPFTMSASPFILRRAPLLGEHTDEVLEDWLRPT